MKKAFTLIELLVVIAIIAILAAILFPVFAKARARAQTTTCASNQRQLSHAILMYADDYDERLPRRWGGPPYETATHYWGMDTFPYYKNLDVLICPTFPRRPYGFGMNYCSTWATGMPLSANQQPTNMILIAEASNWQDPRNPTQNVDRVTPYKWPDDPRFSIDPNRHNNGCNITFLDGHNRWMRFDASKMQWTGNYPAVNLPAGAGIPNKVPAGTYFWPTATAP